MATITHRKAGYQAQVRRKGYPALSASFTTKRDALAWARQIENELDRGLCQRYIELNPVRAAMVEDPAHYRWTSYRANGLGQADARLTPHAVYLALARDDKTRQAAYRELFRAQLDRAAIDDIRLALNQSQPLGNSRFLAKIEKITGERREARPRGRPRVRLDEAGAEGQGRLVD